MKKKTLVYGYKSVKDMKLSKMESSEQFTVIKALRFLKPVSESYEEEMKGLEAKVTSCTQEELKEKRDMAARHNEAERANDKKNMLSSSQIVELNKFFTKVNEEVKGLVDELNDEEVEVTYSKLNEDGFKKLLESNPDMSAESKLVAYELFVS